MRTHGKSFIQFGIIMAFIVLMGFVFEKLIIFTSSGYIIAVVRRTVYEKIAYEFKNIKEVRFFEDDRQSLLELAKGGVNGVIADRLAGLSIIQENGYHNLKLAGDLLNTQRVGVAFNRKDKALRQMVNRALKEIIDNGVYTKISHKYFGCNILQGLKYSPVHPDEPPAADDSWNRVKQAGQIVFAMDGDPPFSYFDDQNELTGFETEIAREVCNRLGVRFIPVPITWDGIIAGLKARHFDGAWGSIVITRKWLKEVDFSNPYYLTGAQLIVREDSSLTGPEILKKGLFNYYFYLPFIFT